MPNRTGLPLGNALHFGWRTLRAQPIFVIGVTLACWGVPLIIQGAGNMVLHSGGQQFAVSLIGLIVSSTLVLGLFKIYLKFRDGETPIIENLFDGVQRFWVMLGASIVASIAIIIGLILLLVPGIIMLIRLMFVPFVIVDERLGPIDAIQRSWDVTRGYALDLFLFLILIVGLNTLGALCLLVGLLISVPVTGLAMAYIYRQLKPRGVPVAVVPAPDLAPVPPPVA